MTSISFKFILDNVKGPLSSNKHTNKQIKRNIRCLWQIRNKKCLGNSILLFLYKDNWIIFLYLKIFKNLSKTLKFIMPFLFLFWILFFLEGRVLKMCSSLWKSNNWLLQNQDYVPQPMTFVMDTLQKLNANFNFCDQTKWEYSRFEIRNFTITFLKEIARKMRKNS